MLEKLNVVLNEKGERRTDHDLCGMGGLADTSTTLQLLSGDSSMDLITTATDWLYAWKISRRTFMPLPRIC